MHSWLPARQRLQGGPCSAPTHFILRRLQTVHALGRVSQITRIHPGKNTPRAAGGLCLDVVLVGGGARHVVVVLALLLRESVETVDAGRLPLRFEDDDGYMCSVGGVPMVSEPWEDGEE